MIVRVRRPDHDHVLRRGRHAGRVVGRAAAAVAALVARGPEAQEGRAEAAAADRVEQLGGRLVVAFPAARIAVGRDVGAERVGRHVGAVGVDAFLVVLLDVLRRVVEAVRTARLVQVRGDAAGGRHALVGAAAVRAVAADRARDVRAVVRHAAGLARGDPVAEVGVRADQPRVVDQHAGARAVQIVRRRLHRVDADRGADPVVHLGQHRGPLIDPAHFVGERQARDRGRVERRDVGVDGTDVAADHLRPDAEHLGPELRGDVGVHLNHEDPTAAVVLAPVAELGCDDPVAHLVLEAQRPDPAHPRVVQRRGVERGRHARIPGVLGQIVEQIDAARGERLALGSGRDLAHLHEDVGAARGRVRGDLGEPRGVVPVRGDEGAGLELNRVGRVGRLGPRAGAGHSESRQEQGREKDPDGQPPPGHGAAWLEHERPPLPFSIRPVGGGPGCKISKRV